jgi:dTMP kinase
MLIVLEGAEGVGKSTQLRRLVARLESARLRVVALREPGGTPLGDEIRRILLDAEHAPTDRAEALLFMASRAELVGRVVRPALAERAVVLLDRFFLSTYAYQVAARGLDEGEVRSANAFATGGLVPDLTLLLALPGGEGLRRAARRGAADRIEREDASFHERVAGAFASFADAGWQRAHPECGAIVAVDASGSEDEVERRIALALAERWPETFPLPSGSHRHG